MLRIPKFLKNFMITILVIVAIPVLVYAVLWCYCLVEDISRTYRDSVTYDKVAEACYEVHEEITPKEFCNYVAATQFPDMTGKCEGEDMQVLEAFLQECKNLRKQHPEKIISSK